MAVVLTHFIIRHHADDDINSLDDVFDSMRSGGAPGRPDVDPFRIPAISDDCQSGLGKIGHHKHPRVLNPIHPVRNFLISDIAYPRNDDQRHKTYRHARQLQESSKRPDAKPSFTVMTPSFTSHGRTRQP